MHKITYSTAAGPRTCFARLNRGTYDSDAYVTVDGVVVEFGFIISAEYVR